MLYLNGHGVVTEEALVFQGNMDALLWSKVNPGVWGTILQEEHVLLKLSWSFG